MKQILTIILVILCLASFADNPEAPKKARKILVKNDLSSDDNFALVGRTLADNEYVIDKKDKEFFTIKTLARDLGKKRRGIHYLYFVIKQGEISVTGKYYLDISFTPDMKIDESSFEKITNSGMSGSPQKNAFLTMQDFALLLGTNLKYITD